jgi:hypothetical protein
MDWHTIASYWPWYYGILGAVVGGFALKRGFLRFADVMERDSRKERDAADARLTKALDTALEKVTQPQARDYQPQPAPAPAPRRMQSPFSFGSAVLEPIVQPMYDSIDLFSGLNDAARHRCFQNLAGKTDKEVSPFITSGGQLSAPRLFVAYRFDHRLELQLDSNQSIDQKLVEADKLKIEQAFSMRFHVGVKDYFQGPLSLLPYSIEKRRLCIPPQQAFYWEFDQVKAITLTYDWKLYAIVHGELGMEVM